MFKNLKISFLLVLVLMILFTGNIAAQQVDRSPRVNLNGITSDNFISQVGVLYPFKNTENSLWFTDLRYRISSDDVHEWNLGLGYRVKKSKDVDNHIAGVYLYKDKRKEYDHYWDMWTLGGEILSKPLDLRVNAYITDNDKVLAPNASAGGPSFRVNESQELLIAAGNAVYYKSMNGVDMELGKRFTETDTIFKDVGIYFKFFNFYESSVGTMLGKQLRIDKQFGNRDKINWKIGAKWREDNMRGSETEATFTVSIPFGKGSTEGTDKEEKAALESRMTDQPERDIDVVVGKAESEEATDTTTEEVSAINPADGEEAVEVWYVTADGSADGDGSKDNPISLNEVSEKAGKGDIIVLSGEDGPINLVKSDKETIEDKPITLDPYQQIISSYKEGHAKVVANLSGNKEEFKFKPEVPMATLRGAPYQNGLVVVQENNTVSGINIVSKSVSSAGILGINFKGNININNNYIEFKPDDSIEENYAIMLRYPETLGDINIKNNELENKNKIVDSTFYSMGILYGPNKSANKSDLGNRVVIENNMINNNFIHGIVFEGDWREIDYKNYEDRLKNNNYFDDDIKDENEVFFGFSPY